MRINERLIKLEQVSKTTSKVFPTLLDDDATDEELEALRKQGIEAYRFTEAVEMFI